MEFVNCEMRPGVVLAVCNNYGTVKASCLGMFSDEDDIDKLPPIYPWFRVSSSGFCEPQIGDEILILVDHSNPQNLRYMFAGDAVDTLGDSLDDGNYGDCEILSSRENAKLQWSDTEGWSMTNDGGSIYIEPQGNISISHEDGQSISLDSDGIRLSTGGDSNPAVLGNELKSCLQSLVNCIQTAAAVGKADPHTTAMAVALESGLMEFNSKLNRILSKNVSLD